MGQAEGSGTRDPNGASVVEQIQPDTQERYSASIEAIAQVDLAFKSAGIVERIYEVRGADGRMRSVQAGDKVAKDTELAQVRPPDYQQRVDQAEAQRAQAEAQLAPEASNLSQADTQSFFEVYRISRYRPPCSSAAGREPAVKSIGIP